VSAHLAAPTSDDGTESGALHLAGHIESARRVLGAERQSARSLARIRTLRPARYLPRRRRRAGRALDDREGCIGRPILRRLGPHAARLTLMRPARAFPCRCSRTVRLLAPALARPFGRSL